MNTCPATPYSRFIASDTRCLIVAASNAAVPAISTVIRASSAASSSVSMSSAVISASLAFTAFMLIASTAPAAIFSAVTEPAASLFVVTLPALSIAPFNAPVSAAAFSLPSGVIARRTPLSAPSGSTQAHSTRKPPE